MTPRAPTDESNRRAASCLVLRPLPDGRLLARSEPWEEEVVLRMQWVEGRAWDPERRAWVLPAGHRTRRRLRRLFPGVALPGGAGGAGGARGG